MRVKFVGTSPFLSSPDEGGSDNDGSLEAAATALSEARAAAATPEPKIKAAPEPAAIAATGEPPETPEVPIEEPDATPEDESDTEEPTIAAPHGWTAEDKAWFDTLEPARQEAILRREKGTQAAESRRQNEHTAAIREAQELREQAAQDRQHLQSALQHYKHPMVTAFQQEFADLQQGTMDLFRLAQDPARWGRYQAFQTSFQQLAQAERQIASQAEQEDNARLQQHIETRNSELLVMKPELKDPAKFEQFDTQVSNYLRAENFPDERIMRVSAQELKIIDKAMKWDKAQLAKAAVPKPQTPPGQPQGNVRQMPRVMKPGMGNSAGAADDKIAAIDQRARKSGSVDDAAARIAARLGKRA